MDIIGIRGPANLPPEKGPGSSKKSKGEKESGSVREKPDTISISKDSSRQAENVNALTEKLQVADPAREAKLEEIKARLDAGELDRPEVFKETAKKILGGMVGE